MVGAIVGFVVGALLFGVIIWIVARLGLGISLENYWWGLVLGVLISLVGHTVREFSPNAGIGASAIIAVIVSALVIYIFGKRLKGITVNGFGGAIIAAISIGVMQYVILWLIGQAV